MQVRTYNVRSLGQKDLRRPRWLLSLFLLPVFLLVWHLTPVGKTLDPVLTDVVGDGLIKLRTRFQFSSLSFGGMQPEELEALKLENQKLRSYVARFYVQQKENIELRTALNYISNQKQTFVTADVVGAVVPARDFLIAAGTSSGVKVGQSVLALGGLVGTVNRTGQDFSWVRPVTHPQSRIAVKLLETSEQAIACGNGHVYLDAFYANPSHKRNVGLLFVTDDFAAQLSKIFCSVA